MFIHADASASDKDKREIPRVRGKNRTCYVKQGQVSQNKR